MEPPNRKVFWNRVEASADVFDYIEHFYNLLHKRFNPDFISPVQFEEGE